jgi:shikimate dehydrogenase
MKQYGLIGHPLSHSFSKKYFIKKFKREKILDSTFELFDIEKIELFKEILINNPNLLGLSVTIPYKELIIPYLTEIDERAKEIGSVNSIFIDQTNNKLKGYNTDYNGFKKSLKPFLEKNHDRALILGTGGVSKAVLYTLKELNIDCLFVSRNPKNNKEIAYNDINEYVIQHHQLIINTTPVGMFPNIEDYPNIKYSYLTSNHLLYDLIYNPAETAFIKKGKEQGCTTLNGMEMLELQAEKSWEIWNS